MAVLIPVYLILAFFMLGPLLGLAYATRRAPPARRLLYWTVAATLLLTPTWVPATITMISAPFGLPFFIIVATWDWRGLQQLVAEYPVWHAIAFPATALVAALLGRAYLRAKATTGLAHRTGDEA